ncbi:PTS system mannose-specific EIIAB component [Streptococcus pluranimalium]|uniref:PTS sugar transporter subunit IIA n=1 Tax=Streptococcus pluranimalium TaxID=82348 RepID=UPI0039ECAC63
MNILITTHGTLAEGFKDALSVILGDPTDIVTIGLMAGESVSDFGSRVSESLNKFDNSKGTIIFTDLLSASPFNQSLLAIRGLSNEEAQNIFVVSGVSLPMILETVNHNLLESDLETVVKSLENFVSTEDAIWHITDSLNDDDDEF